MKATKEKVFLSTSSSSVICDLHTLDYLVVERRKCGLSLKGMKDQERGGVIVVEGIIAPIYYILKAKYQTSEQEVLFEHQGQAGGNESHCIVVKC